jgi:hypothetical protein
MAITDRSACRYWMKPIVVLSTTTIRITTASVVSPMASVSTPTATRTRASGLRMDLAEDNRDGRLLV